MKRKSLLTVLGSLLLGLQFSHAQWTVNDHIGNVETFAGSGIEGLQNGDAETARFYNPKGMAMDQDGNIFVADDYNDVIRKITPKGIVSTFAGTGVLGYYNGHRNMAQFARPQDVVFDSKGNLYVADALNYVIRKITPEGMVSLFAGIAGESGYKDGPNKNATFKWPAALAVDAFDNIYVAGGKKIRRIAPEGMVMTIYNGYASIWGIDSDASGNIYFADFFNYVRKITNEGIVENLAGGNSGCADLPDAQVGFGFPEDVVVDADGNVYVADGTNYRIRKIAPNGMVTTIAGDGCLHSFWGENQIVDGAAETAQFGRLRGMLLKPDGNLLVTSWSNDAIREIQLGSEPLKLVVLESNLHNTYQTTTLRQMEPLHFDGMVWNIGEEVIAKINLTVNVEKEGQTVFESTSQSLELADWQSDILAIEEPFVPTEIGNYQVRFTYSTSDMGAVITRFDHFTVSDAVMAQDDGLAYSFYRLDQNFYASLGTEFTLRQTDTLTAIHVQGLFSNTNLHFSVFRFSENETPQELLYSSDTTLVENQNKFSHSLSEPLVLPPGTYLFAVGNDNSPGDLWVGYDSDNPVTTGWLKSPNFDIAEWQTMQSIFGLSDFPALMIRPVFNPSLIVATEDIEILPIQVQLSPNPVFDELSIAIQAERLEAFHVQIFDVTGKMVKAFKIQSGAATSLNLKPFSSGAYLIKIFNENGMITKKVIKE